jgi:hypothetical protein
MTNLKPPGENEYDVWANGCFNPPRVLLVVSSGDEGPYSILDPGNDNARVFVAEEFLEVVDYLCEEDYERVSGRMAFDECEEDEEEEDDDE